MAEQDSNDIVIQLPWTVPQQPSVQTIVLQQPAKAHMETKCFSRQNGYFVFCTFSRHCPDSGVSNVVLAYWYGRILKLLI